MCIDKGYDYPAIWQLTVYLGYRPHIRSGGEEAKRCKAGKRAQRWAVECTRSWINRLRGLLICWAKKAENYLAFLYLQLACSVITWRSIGLLG
ncbi:transposase [Noviherbaspirillum galbum]|uniref:Transposase n=1 Tax=Noviherbaspirillum galbum TaxID=2709383 RepID=A0A6B3SGG6_9BURK|nr:transposase [Noviherbaspirillum galbum]